jgi:hypothetical protein
MYDSFKGCFPFPFGIYGVLFIINEKDTAEPLKLKTSRSFHLQIKSWNLSKFCFNVFPLLISHI